MSGTVPDDDVLPALTLVQLVDDYSIEKERLHVAPLVLSSLMLDGEEVEVEVTQGLLGNRPERQAFSFHSLRAGFLATAGVGETTVSLLVGGASAHDRVVRAGGVWSSYVPRTITGSSYEAIADRMEAKRSSTVELTVAKRQCPSDVVAEITECVGDCDIVL
jgi:hypothetical protein